MSLEPIELTAYGEKLNPYPGAENRDPEEYKLSSCCGVHAICGGWVDVCNVSETHKALVCRSCKLRVVILQQVITWKQLQTHIKFVGLKK